jgi:hypothetical protein
VQWKTYPGTVWRLSVFLIVVPHFVEIVLVELSDKTRKVAVLKVLGQDVLGKLFVLVMLLATCVRPCAIASRIYL